MAQNVPIFSERQEILPNFGCKDPLEPVKFLKIQLCMAFTNGAVGFYPRGGGFSRLPF
ncbi:hypothetical protein [Carnobacterium mobile]|uniref:hypothetical protein n=1 Tax=Carnobacterium mobile TaxID=2750 RepID=UPI001D009BD6|nr:hypothetical protein [Carnobacterium mobile]